ncbi:MAG: hypothetical protein JJV97_01070 [SAR324 cluster bacterium]|nr:hypothetical protein [SAR324 cluster bacterium]
MKTDNLNYLELVEDHKEGEQKPLPLFEKILLANSRAKDLQKMSVLRKIGNYSFEYQALMEYKQDMLIPKITDKPEESVSMDFDDDDDDDE